MRANGYGNQSICVLPGEIHHHIATVIVGPMTAKGREYPSRVKCTFEGKEGQIVLDQIRTVDKVRLVKKLGKINIDPRKEVLSVLMEMFSE